MGQGQGPKQKQTPKQRQRHRGGVRYPNHSGPAGPQCPGLDPDSCHIVTRECDSRRARTRSAHCPSWFLPDKLTFRLALQRECPCGVIPQKARRSSCHQHFFSLYRLDRIRRCYPKRGAIGRCVQR
jgi:hypothetical protein